MASTADFRNGLVLELDGQLYQLTGATVQVPQFIEEGEMIRVDRRADKYLTRV